MQPRDRALLLATAVSLALVGCDRGGGADRNPSAPGTTGSGTTDATGRAQSAPTGAGLQGGMGTGAASAPAGTAPGGSTNRTTAGSVGNR
jgi:hypothetical protein